MQDSQNSRSILEKMLEAVLWLALIELIGLLALPTTFAVFRFLPERGYTLAKPLGLLATSYGVWLLSMAGLPFAAPLAWAVLVGLFGLLNGWLLLRQGRRLWSELRSWLATHAWLIVIAEVIFLLAYFYLVNLRSYMPDIRDQEKFGDFAFLNSLTLNTKMPPADPWMSGYPINYYYFSHFMMAMLTKMTGIAPAIAFNLTIPLVFGMTALASFGIVFNLVSLARKRPGLAVPVLVGLLGLAMVCLMGNLDAVRQIFFPHPDKYETGLENFIFSWWTPSRVIFDNMPIPNGVGGVNYQWQETINEFPMFSFLLADMHPHVMTLPTALLAVGLALNSWLVPAGSPAMQLRRPEGILLFGTTALVIGSLYFLNTWDYPTYLILIVLATFWRARRLGSLENRAGRFGSALWRWAGRSLGLVVASLVLFLPFLLTFVSLVGDNAVPEPIGSIPILNTVAKNISFVAWDRTPLLGYFLVFGVFLFPLLSFLLVKLWPYLRHPYAYLNDEVEEEGFVPLSLHTAWSYPVAIAGLVVLIGSEVGFFLLNLNPLITILLGLIAAPLLAVGTATIALEILAARRKDRPRLELLAVTVGLALIMILSGYLLHFELYGPLLIAAVFIVLLLWFETGVRGQGSGISRQRSEVRGDRGSEGLADQSTIYNLQSTIPGIGDQNPIYNLQSTISTSQQLATSNQQLATSDLFVLAMCLLPVVITFGTELILIRDVFNSRLNTLFKFYYQAWVLFGLGGAYGSWRLIAWAWQLSPFGQDGEATEVGEVKAVTTPMIRPASPVGRPVPQPQVALRLSPAIGLAGGGNLAFSTGVMSGGLPRPTYGDYGTDDLEDEADAAREYEMSRPRRPWWRWLWTLGLSLLLLGGLVYPVFGPYEKSGHYAKRIGLDGSIWLRDGGATGGPMTADYTAIQWLRGQIAANPNFYAPILEAPGWDWRDYARVSTFSGLPTLLGWVGHEDQWRGGKAAPNKDSFECWQVVHDNGLDADFARLGLVKPVQVLQKDEPPCRYQLMETMYRTTDATLAQNLLKATGVRYVYVGMVETGASDARDADRRNDPNRVYSPIALAKFSQFMRTIYQQDGVTIYSF